MENQEKKFCSSCGKEIAAQAVVCPHCGCQVANMNQQQAQPQIVIQNTNQNQVNVVGGGKAKNKWVALLLLWFLGALGGHKFYEGKVLMGILYFFTLGFCGIGCFIDFFALLFKPNPYYV